MEIALPIMLLLVVGTSIWVYADAKSIGVRKGLIPGFADMSAGGWLAVCLLLWIVGFPMYLAKRTELQRAARGGGSVAVTGAGEAPMRFCTTCGTQGRIDAEYCAGCGRSSVAPHV